MDNNLIFGIRPVVEAIEAGREIEKLYIRKGAVGQLMTELRDLCLRHRVQCVPRYITTVVLPYPYLKSGQSHS